MLILVISLSQVVRMPTNKKYVKKCVIAPPAHASAAPARPTVCGNKSNVLNMEHQLRGTAVAEPLDTTSCGTLVSESIFAIKHKFSYY